MEDSDSKTSEFNKQAIEIATDYIKKHFSDSVSTSLNGEVIWISDKEKMYEIDPNKIYNGLIDADSTNDALVTLNSFVGQEPGYPEHLILLNTNGKLALDKSFVLDMKVLSLKDRLITGEIHTKPRSSPLYNCSHCLAIVKYKFENGDTVKIN